MDVLLKHIIKWLIKKKIINNISYLPFYSTKILIKLFFIYIIINDKNKKKTYKRSIKRIKKQKKMNGGSIELFVDNQKKIIHLLF